MNPVEEGMNKEREWEMRPGGMLVQKREDGSDDDNINLPLYKIKVSFGSSFFDFTVPCKFTFGIFFFIFYLYNYCYFLGFSLFFNLCLVVHC